MEKLDILPVSALSYFLVEEDRVCCNFFIQRHLHGSLRREPPESRGKRLARGGLHTACKGAAGHCLPQIPNVINKFSTSRLHGNLSRQNASTCGEQIPGPHDSAFATSRFLWRPRRRRRRRDVREGATKRNREEIASASFSRGASKEKSRKWPIMSGSAANRVRLSRRAGQFVWRPPNSLDIGSPIG
jgi:hypothetical protein